MERIIHLRILAIKQSEQNENYFLDFIKICHARLKLR